MAERGPQFKQPPVGEARELNKSASERWRERFLLFSRVKNKVLFVNPEVYAPLKLKEGKPSPLGLFVEASLQEKPAGHVKGKRTMEVWHQHTRSALLGRVIFGDKKRKLYRDVDLKGVGYFTESNISQLGETNYTTSRYTLPRGSFGGILNSDYAFFDYQMSEDFIRKGIRTTRVIAIIELKEIISNGKKISIEEAKKLGLLGKDMTPVVEIRAFATKFRIADVDRLAGRYREDMEARKILLQDAKQIVSRELSLKETMSDKQYMEWFAKTLGRNVALIHRNGWFHDYLTTHNITLDCRIVDLDGVSNLITEYDRSDDVERAYKALEEFVNIAVKNQEIDDDTVDYSSLFYRSYNAVFPPEAREKYFQKNRGN